MFKMVYNNGKIKEEILFLIRNGNILLECWWLMLNQIQAKVHHPGLTKREVMQWPILGYVHKYTSLSTHV